MADKSFCLFCFKYVVNFKNHYLCHGNSFSFMLTLRQKCFVWQATTTNLNNELSYF